MACPTIITGDRFLERVLTHIDCQAQVIGSFGYQALGQPGSTASLMVTGLLTLFVALFGIRLLFGPPPGARDLVYDVLKIGIVLTLAFSWPAFRTVIYDVTLKGPAEIASVVQSSSQSGSQASLVRRLQEVDNTIVEFITVGTGRNSGASLDPQTAIPSFAGSALQDDAAFGYSRLLFLAGVIAPLALLRIGAAVLLALAPVVAGLFFFTQSRGILAGWARGLVFTIGGSIAISLGLVVQLGIVEPWLADATQVRALGYATPAAPLELFATMFAFMIVHLALLWLLARVTFYRGWQALPAWPDNRAGAQGMSGPALQPVRAADTPATAPVANRVERISNAVQSTIQRERSSSMSERLIRETAPAQSGGSPSAPGAEPTRLGNSYRRTNIRPLRSITRRDDTI